MPAGQRHAGDVFCSAALFNAKERFSRSAGYRYESGGRGGAGWGHRVAEQAVHPPVCGCGSGHSACENRHTVMTLPSLTTAPSHLPPRICGRVWFLHLTGLENVYMILGGSEGPVCTVPMPHGHRGAFRAAERRGVSVRSYRSFGDLDQGAPSSQQQQ